MSNLLDRIREARKANQADESPGVSTTDSFEILLTEAKLAAEGRVNNYHVPASEEVLGGVQARCKEQDLEPAWRVIDGVR
jgi:hypothetical protein